jgi:monofunctional glycosyltransferase
MADAKPRKARRVALGTAALALAWLFAVWPPPMWWRDHWPRATAMMRRAGPTGAHLRPEHLVPLRDISPVLRRMVVIGEDSRFATHHGIDPAEIADAIGADRGAGVWGTIAAAWRHRDRVRGASTITQQLAKNLYLSPSRNPLRKLKEGVTALRLELALPKDRILELYLNVAEWGPGIWGVQEASRVYFGVLPSELDETQAAALAATLPQPRTSNPAFRPERMIARRNLILARYHGVGVYIPPPEEGDTLAPILPLPPIAPPPIDSPPIARPPTDSGAAPGRVPPDSV